MFYMNWPPFTLIAAVRRAVTFLVVFRYTGSSKNLPGSGERRKDTVVSVIQEVLTSIRVVKASPGKIRAKTSGRRKPGKCRAIAARAQPEGQAVRPWSRLSSHGTSLVLFFRRADGAGRLAGARFAVVFNLVPREDVQAMQGAFQDDGRLFEGCRGI